MSDFYSELNYRALWLEACHQLCRTTAKLENEWDCTSPEGERSYDGWCWAEAQAARDYLNQHAEELEDSEGWWQR
jgi:hypothetical protein